MPRNIQKVTVDIKEARNMFDGTVYAGDAVTFSVEVTDNGQAADLSDVDTFLLIHKRPHMKAIVTPGKLISGNLIEFKLGTSEISIPGTVEASVQLYDEEGRVTPMTFSYNVKADPTAQGLEVSTTDKTFIEIVLGEGPDVIQGAKEATAAAAGATAETKRVKAETEEVKNLTAEVLGAAETAVTDTKAATISANNAAATAAEKAGYAEEQGDKAKAEAEAAAAQKLEVAEVLGAGPVYSVNGKTGAVEGLATIAQLADKVGGGKKATLEDLDAITLAAIEGGAGTSFNLLSVPQDNSVTPEKIATRAVIRDKLHEHFLHNGRIGITESIDGDFADGNYIVTAGNPGTFPTDANNQHAWYLEVKTINDAWAFQTLGSLTNPDIKYERHKKKGSTDKGEWSRLLTRQNAKEFPEISQSAKGLNKNLGVDYPLKNIQRNGQTYTISDMAKNAILDIKITNPKPGKQYAIHTIGNSVSNGYGFTIKEYDRLTWSGEREIFNWKTNGLKPPPETPIKTQVLESGDMIFSITVNYAATHLSAMYFANSEASQAYGAIIDESCYVYTGADYLKNLILESDPRTLQSKKVLFIGNSYSLNAVELLKNIADSASVDLIVGVIYDSGQSIEGHYNKITENSTVTYYHEWSTNTGYIRENDVTHTHCITKHEWDLIVFQQSSSLSADASSYQPFLSDLHSVVDGLATNESVEYGLHLVWSRANPVTHPSSVEMYQDYKDAYLAAAAGMDFDVVIPTGTAIENARTNSYLAAVNDRLTRDNSHLDEGIGYYIAALTVFGSLYNKDVVKDVSYYPTTHGATKFLAHLSKIAAKNALLNPYEITEM